MRTENRRRQQGVTLAELLVASVILTISLLGVHQAGRTVLKAAAETEKKAETVEELSGAFMLIERDLRAAVIFENDPEMKMTGGNGDKGSTLSFMTLSGDSTVWRTGWRPGVSKVIYAAEDGRLTRRESSTVRPGQESVTVLLPQIDRMTLQFHGKEGVTDSWDSEKDLPRAVELELVAAGFGCRTMVCLPAAEGQIE